MRRLKKKMMVMCTIAMICAGVLCFSSCTPWQIWLTADALTLATIMLTEDKITAEKTQEEFEEFIDGIVDFSDGVKSVYNWILSVVTPK